MRAHMRYSVKLLKPEAILKDVLNAECLLSSFAHRFQETCCLPLREGCTYGTWILTCTDLSGGEADWSGVLTVWGHALFAPKIFGGAWHGAGLSPFSFIAPQRSPLGLQKVEAGEILRQQVSEKIVLMCRLCLRRALRVRPLTLQATGLGAADCSALRKVARSCWSTSWEAGDVQGCLCQYLRFWRVSSFKSLARGGMLFIGACRL